MKKHTLCIFFVLAWCVINLNAINGGFSGPESDCKKKCSTKFAIRNLHNQKIEEQIQKICWEDPVQKVYWCDKNQYYPAENYFYKKNLKLYIACLKNCYKAKE